MMRDTYYLTKYLVRTLRWRLLLWLSFLFMVALLDGVTIGLFLPIIAGADSDSALARMVITAFDTVGLEYSLPTALAAMLAMYATRTGAFFVQEVYAAHIVTNLLVEIKSQTVDRILGVRYDYFVSKGLAYFNNAVTVEFTNLSMAFESLVRAVVFAVICLGHVALATLVRPEIALAVAFLAMPAYVLMTKALKKVRKLSGYNTANNQLLQSHLIQMLTGFKYFKGTGASDGLGRLLRSTIGLQGRLIFQQSRLGTMVRNGVELVGIVVVVGAPVLLRRSGRQAVVRVGVRVCSCCAAHSCLR